MGNSLQLFLYHLLAGRVIDCVIDEKVTLMLQIIEKIFITTVKNAIITNLSQVRKSNEEFGPGAGKC